MRSLPSGTVTFLFSDIEGSTRLLDELGADGYADALAEHRRLMREAFLAHDGVEVDTQGDAFFVAFASAKGAVSAAAEAQAALAQGPIRVRMGIHSGEPLLTAGGYVGIDVHQGARVMAAGHGGQVLVSYATHALLGTEFALRDLGRHRLKDLTEPQPLYQLGAGEFPPPKTLSQTNLPVQPTPLVGREAELAEVLALLSESRLVTLTGAGGSGKTRLALQAAAEVVDDYPQGVWWVSLAALRDPALVESTIAQVVGSKNGLAEHLRDQKMLIVVDNVEQVLVGAATHLGAVLAQAPDIRVLATSRERLGLTGEHEYPLPTMATDEAVALFTARARQLKAGFVPDEAVGEICRRVDGLPLAVELAAARIKVLRPEQILARLGSRLELLTTGARDAPERQQTLRAAITWSFDLLGEDEQSLFTRVAVFAGSFDVEAAETVCEADLDTLASLLDKSLLRQTAEGRFFMLETIREYALERFEASAEAEELRRRHADYVLRLLEAAYGHLRRPGEKAWIHAIEAEHENIRGALAWAEANDENEFTLAIAARAAHFWYVRAYIAEGLRHLERALAASRGERSELRGLALKGAGVLACSQGEYERARAFAEEGVSMLTDLGAPREVLNALNALASIFVDTGQHEQAREALDRALEMARAGVDDYDVAMTLANLGNLALAEYDYSRAVELGSQASDLLARLDVAHGLAITWSNTALAELALGNASRAESLFADALRLASENDIAEVPPWCLTGLAAVSSRRRDFERAASLLGLAETLMAETGAALERSERELFDHTRAVCEDGLGRDNFAAAEQAGRSLDIKEVVSNFIALSAEEPSDAP